jgi:hypothetical protein
LVVTEKSGLWRAGHSVTAEKEPEKVFSGLIGQERMRVNIPTRTWFYSGSRLALDSIGVSQEGVRAVSTFHQGILFS